MGSGQEKSESFTNGKEALVMRRGMCSPTKHYIPPPWNTGKMCQCGLRKLKFMIVEGGKVVAFEATVVKPRKRRNPKLGK